MNTVEVSYSKEQDDAFINNRLYDHPYGIFSYEYEYMKAELIKMGYQGTHLLHKMDDAKGRHILLIPDEHKVHTPIPLR